MRKQQEMQSRQSVGRRYKSYFKSQGFSEQESSALEDLLLKREMVSRYQFWDDAENAGRLSGKAEDYRKLQQDRDAKKTEVEEAIKKFLGADRYAELQRYNDTKTSRDIVGRFQTELGLYGEPLNATQRDLLVEIMHEAGADKVQGSQSTFSISGPGGSFEVSAPVFNASAAGGDKAEQIDAWLDQQAAYYNTVLERSASVLTLEQQDSLKNYFQEQLINAEKQGETQKEGGPSIITFSGDGAVGGGGSGALSITFDGVNEQNAVSQEP
jgi:hypothetical protein